MSSYYLEGPWRKAISEAFDRGVATGQLRLVRAESETAALQETVRKLRDREREFIDALYFYADEENYDDDGTADWPDRSVPVQNDEGERARAVLARSAQDNDGGERK